MVPSRVAGGMVQSSSSSEIFSQGDGQSQVTGNSQLSSNFGNTLNSLPRCPASGDVGNTVLNSVASSGPSVGASSLVTDANSSLSGGPHLQHSASTNTESYMRLPASPMSFSSNNISISGSPVMDGSSIVQQSSNQDPSFQQAEQSQQHQRVSSATSLPHISQVRSRGPGSFAQDPTIYQLPKKPRMDINQEGIVQQGFQRQDAIHLQNPNPQVQALSQQQRLRQQEQEQQLLLAMSPAQRTHYLRQRQYLLLQQEQLQLRQQQQQLQLRQQQQQLQLQVQRMPPASAVKQPYDGGVCLHRFMKYLYHKRQRPTDNAIVFWKKFVAEYYSPHAKQRCCLSLNDKIGHHSVGVFPQAAMGACAWQCELCGSNSGKGYEANFDVLPRLYASKFGSGVIDDLLYLDLPHESRSASGKLRLVYEKAVQETVYEQHRVVHKGQLRIIFTPEPDLKILSWDFCVRSHETHISCGSVAQQVNQLVQVAQKCQSAISEGASQTDLQANCDMMVKATQQLANSLDLQSINEFGFPKSYARCLQLGDVANSMKGLMDYCGDQKQGPIEGLKNFTRHSTTSKVPMQQMTHGMNQIGCHQNPPTGGNTMLHPGLNTQMYINNQQSGSRGAALSGSPQALSNHQNMMRQNSMNSISSSIQQEASHRLISPGTFQNSSVSGLSSSPQHPQLQQQSASGNGLQQNGPSQLLQQQMVRQYMQDLSTRNNGGAVSQQTLSVQNKNDNVSAGGPDFRNPLATTSSNVSAGGPDFRNPPATTSSGNSAGTAQGQAPKVSNSLKPASSNSEFPALTGFEQKMLENTAPDKTEEFNTDDFFNDMDDDE